jgi:hypothetical protein
VVILSKISLSQPSPFSKWVRFVFWKARGITQYDSFEKYDALPPKRHKPHLGSFVSLDEEKDKNRKPKRSLPLINPCWQED